jgi:5-methylthioadenosine/S-adenosylhomocysteine deaminase
MAQTTILANGTVLACDAMDHCGRIHMLIGGRHILALSRNLDSLRKENPDATILDVKEKLILPGFVNAHFHGESFLLRRLTDGIHFGLWNGLVPLRQAVDKLLDRSSYDDVRRLYRAAYLAHLKSGTTCVGEFPALYDDEAFLRVIESVAESGVATIVALQNWDQIRKVQAMRENKPRAAISLGREEEFTVYSIEKLSQAAKGLRTPLLAHIGEQRSDMETVRKNFQKSTVALLNSFNAFAAGTILVHANHAGEDEVQIIHDAGGTVVVCPRSTAWKQTGYPALRHLAKQHVRLALGTDWGEVDMLEEMRFMSTLPLLVAGLPMFPATEILKMATIHGAQALGFSEELGSIEVGKRATLVMFDIADIRLPVLSQAPTASEMADLVIHHLTTRDITDVVIDGEFRVREREAAGESDIIEELYALARKFIPQHEQTQQGPAEQGANVLPFIAEVRSPQGETEGFESGFAEKARQATIVEIAEKPVNPLINRPKPARDPIKPELPPNTKRVFGEDDDV